MPKLFVIASISGGHTLGTQTQHNISQLCVIMDLHMACCSIIHYSMRICLQARARKDGAEDEVC